jgi:hypothetical protein
MQSTKESRKKVVVFAVLTVSPPTETSNHVHSVPTKQRTKWKKTVKFLTVVSSKNSRPTVRFQDTSQQTLILEECSEFSCSECLTVLTVHVYTQVEPYFVCKNANRMKVFLSKILLLIWELPHTCSLQKWRQLDCAEGLSKCWNFSARRGEGRMHIWCLGYVWYSTPCITKFLTPWSRIILENLMVSSTTKQTNKNLHLIQPTESLVFSLTGSWAIRTKSSTVNSVYSDLFFIIILRAPRS